MQALFFNAISLPIDKEIFAIFIHYVTQKSHEGDLSVCRM